MNQSTKWNLSVADVERWLRNAGVFLAPVAVIYLLSIVPLLQNGFSWSAFVPDPMVVGAMVLYLINTALDFFKKLAAGPTTTQTTPLA